MAKGGDGKGKGRSRPATGEELLARVPDGLIPAPVWQRALGRFTGARACYGKPIEAHGHVVIPVATLRTIGGLGIGSDPALQTVSPGPDDPPSGRGDQGGAGGGGYLSARPVGFIDIGPDGVRYEPIIVARTPAGPRTTALVTLGVLTAARILAGPLRRRHGLIGRRRPVALPWSVPASRR